MKEKHQKKLKETKGITLIALVITIIVLLILTGVSLSMILSQDGIFSRAENSTQQWKKSGAREELELVLGEVQMSKYEEGLSGENYENRLDNKIQEIGELLDKDTTNPNYQQVIVEGFIFLIDRNVPRVVEYVGPADGVVITAAINGLSNGWIKQDEVANISVTGKIKTYSGGAITTVSATKDGTEITEFSIDAEGKYIINDITANTTIVIKATDSNNKENSKTVPIIIKIDRTAPTVEKVNAKTEIVDDKYIIKISANGHDKNSSGEEESGIKQFIYKITPLDGIEERLDGIEEEKHTGTFKFNQTIEILTTKALNYNIEVTAEDNVGNELRAPAKSIALTGGVIKHINTPTGLKEANTLDIYGAHVTGYNCTRKSDDKSELEWQIFYIDEEDNHRVYLIAKDYMVPPTTNTELTYRNSPHSYSWNDTVLNKYETTLPKSDTSTSLGKFMGKFLSNYAGISAFSKTNLQATNYMLDQEVWDEYLGEERRTCVWRTYSSTPMCSA